METVSVYRTVSELSEGLFKEKGSKFIGYAVPCYTEEEAKKYLDEWRKKHYQARHVCYAYRFGLDKKIFRYNDDGEPNNSAGAPIFGQIQSYDLSNVLIGVVRYFGGTKLGVGGLVQAYKTAAKEAIDNAKIIECEVFNWLELSFPYDSLPETMNKIKQYSLFTSDQNFDLNCSLIVRIPLNLAEQLKQEFSSFDGMKIIDKGNY